MNVRAIATTIYAIGLSSMTALAQTEPEATGAVPERATPTTFPVYSQSQRNAVVSESSDLLLEIMTSSMFAGNEALDKPQKTAKLTARARAILAPLLADPEMDNVDVWRCAGGLSIVIDDVSLAAHAHEVLSKIEQTDANKNWLGPMLKQLAAQPFAERLEQTREARRTFLEALALARQPAATPERAEARGLVAACYSDGLAIAQSDAEALHWFTLAAADGNLDSMDDVGIMHYQGRGTDQNYTKAVEWFARAADLGHASAMYNLGVCYELGSGVDHSDAKARQWYERAADLGSVDALFNMGGLLTKADGSERDPQQGLIWYKRAAKEGHSGAMLNIGLMHFQGEDIKQEIGLGMSWIIRAGEAGDVDAMWTATQIYYNGENVDKNMELALHWMRLAAQHGHADAMYNLGVMLYSGTDVEQNETEALRWIDNAAQLGHPLALEAIKQLKP